MSAVISKDVNEQDDTMIVPHHRGVAVEGVEEGSVLMSVGGNVILRLNEVGTLIWQVLEDGRDKGGLEAGDVFTRLVPILEGCLTEPVPRKHVKRDLMNFLDVLLQKSLLEAIDISDAKRLYLVPDGIHWSKKKDPTSSIASLERLNGTFEIDEEALRSSNKPRRISVLTALLALVLFDLFTKIYRFDKVHRIIERQSLRSRRRQAAIHAVEDCRRICEAVDQAQIYYYKQILCLQRSTVAACLLWRRGIPAELIIAARMIPFQSHAWVELSGEVVNDHPSVRGRYDCVIERIGANQPV
jgi:hypothetical protein